MKPTRLIASVLGMALLFSCGAALPAEKAKTPPKMPAKAPVAIKIDQPTAPIAVGEEIELEVVGIPVEFFSLPDPTTKIRLTCWPMDGVKCKPVRDWFGKTTIEFRAKKAAEYKIYLTLWTPEGLSAQEVKITVEGDSVNPPNPGPVPTPEPGDNPWKPSSAWKSQCSPILSLKLSTSDARALASLYGNLSKPANLANLATTGDLRQRLIQEGSSLGLRGKYQGLAEAVESYLAVSVRTANVPLNREAAGPVLETLAWAIWETGRGQ